MSRDGFIKRPLDGEVIRLEYLLQGREDLIGKRPFLVPPKSIGRGAAHIAKLRRKLVFAGVRDLGLGVEIDDVATHPGDDAGRTVRRRTEVNLVSEQIGVESQHVALERLSRKPSPCWIVELDSGVGDLHDDGARVGWRHDVERS